MKRAINYPETRLKQFLKLHLISEGWDVEVTRRLNHSYDIAAIRGNERWIIETNSLIDDNVVNSFTAALGELLQRMDIEGPQHKYSIALPDNKPFHRLWDRLPLLAKRKYGITALFIEEDGKITEQHK